MTDRVAVNEVQRTEAVRTTKDGRRLVVSIAMSPIVDDDGTPIGYSLIVRDITEQKRIQAALEEARAELERSNRDLQDFASVASHDLQEPLRKIRAFTDRLARRAGDTLDAESTADLVRVQDAAARMQQLIEDLLAYSRVTTRARRFEPVDLRRVVRTVQDDLEQAIVESGGRVDVGPLPEIEADPVQMRQLLQNLIGNALKFRCPVAHPSSPCAPRRNRARMQKAIHGSPDHRRLGQRDRYRCAPRRTHLPAVRAPPRADGIPGYRHGPRDLHAHCQAPRRQHQGERGFR